MPWGQWGSMGLAVCWGRARRGHSGDDDDSVTISISSEATPAEWPAVATSPSSFQKNAGVSGSPGNPLASQTPLQLERPRDLLLASEQPVEAR